jgi:hypothetical protein
MVSREREIAERYTKKTLAHIKWLSALPPLQSLRVRRHDLLRHCVLLREMIREGYDAPDLPTADFLRRTQEGLVQIRKMRAIAKQSLH